MVTTNIVVPRLFSLSAKKREKQDQTDFIVDFLHKTFTHVRHSYNSGNAVIGTVHNQVFSGPKNQV